MRRTDTHARAAGMGTRLATLALAALIGGTTALAQGKQEITPEDIFALVGSGNITTATKTERLLKTAPLAVTVITRQQLDEMGASSITDALRLVPGMNVRWTPMGRVFGIRSLGSTPFSSRVLVLVDGVPYNSPDKGGLSGHPAYEDFFPIDHVKRIEVVKAPGSALYGQNAFQGVVNIITMDAAEFSGTNVDVSTGQRAMGQGRVSHGGTNGDLGYSFTGAYKRENGPMEFQSASLVNSGDGYLKLGYKGLGVSYLFHHDTFDSYERQGATLPTDQTLNLLAVSHAKQLTSELSSSLKVLYNRRDGSTCANCHDHTGAGTFLNGVPATRAVIESEHETNQRFWINEQLDWTPSASRHKFVFGGEYQADRVTKNIVKRLDSQPNIGTVGAFVQDELAFLDKRLLATLGARLDRNQITGSSFSPSGSLVYLPHEKLVVRASVGRAFRQPTWNDLFISQRFSPAAAANAGVVTEFRRVGNPDLAPERITTAEAGAEYFFNAAYSIKADVFHSTIADYIQGEDFSLRVGAAGQPPRPVAIGPGPAVAMALATNRATDIHTNGGEIEFRAKPNTVVSGIVGYAYQTDDVDPLVDSQAAYMPKHKVTAMVTANPIERLSIAFDMNTWSHFNARAVGLTLGLTNAAGIVFGDRVGDAYAIANLTANVLLVSHPNAKVGISLQLKDLFDQRVQETPVAAVNTSLRGREGFVKLYFKF